MVGRALGHYQVLEKLGAGGMGEVYRARDTRLGREVAIKVLPPAFAKDPDRLARFEREAQVLASLNHPNIAALYGLEEFEGQKFLVMELVPGKTLAGPLPPEDALGIARQIAEALEAAHERSVIHRDLKPANIKVTAEGKVKVLDFGLAKAFQGEAAADLSHSPTATLGATREGVVLGTAAYMSPEQARGKPVDRRTDIWSFGCVVYELLAGQRAFHGETLSDTSAAILTREADWQALPATTPARIRELLRRCLQKDPHLRLHDIADARIEIQEALAVPSAAWPAPGVPPDAPPVAIRPRRAIALSLACAIAIFAALSTGVLVWILRRPSSSLPRPITRFNITLPPTDSLATAYQPALALSPDGTRLAYAASRGGSAQLYLRELDQLQAKPLPGTEDASGPFFSPDGQWIGFFASGKLKKVLLAGGRPFILCDTPSGRGANWGPDDTIVYTPAPGMGIWRVSASGGKPQALSTPDFKKGERTYRWPQILPGGKAILFTLRKATHASFDEAQIAVLSLETGKQRVLIEGGTDARYVATGHLLFAREKSLLAVPFDVARLQVTGPVAPVLDGVAIAPPTGAAQFAVSRVGSLVYVPGAPRMAERTLVWVDRKGRIRQIPVPPHPYARPHLSPDGRRLAVTIEAASDDVWIYEVTRGTLSRLTFETSNIAPIWTPDGGRITFSSNRLGAYNLFWQAADGTGEAERLLASEQILFPGSWSPDGKVLAFTVINPATGWDIWVLPLGGGRMPHPFLQTPFSEHGPQFSPDGQWLAYDSDESGQAEVYVRSYPGQGGKWQISTEGGSEPVWARNGRELFYRHGGKMMAVEVTTGSKFSAAKPRALFEGSFEEGIPRYPNYDISPDGQRFVMIQAQQESAPAQLNFVLEWFEDLKHRVAAGKN